MTASMNEKTKARIYATVGVIAVVVFLSWAAEKRGEEFDASMTAYEDCVQAEYGRSPSSFYQEHGYYPECVTTAK